MLSHYALSHQLHCPQDLQAAVLDLRSEAASLVELVSPAEKAELLAGLQALPTKQLEAAIAFLASRHSLTFQQPEDSAQLANVRKSSSTIKNNSLRKLCIARKSGNFTDA